MTDVQKGDFMVNIMNAAEAAEKALSELIRQDSTSDGKLFLMRQKATIINDAYQECRQYQHIEFRVSAN